VSTCCRSSPAAPPAPALPRLAPPSVSRVAAHALQASSKYVTQKPVHTACSPPPMQPLARQALLSAQSTPHFAYQATKRANPTKKPYPGRKSASVWGREGAPKQRVRGLMYYIQRWDCFVLHQDKCLLILFHTIDTAGQHACARCCGAIAGRARPEPRMVAGDHRLAGAADHAGSAPACV